MFCQLSKLLALNSRTSYGGWTGKDLKGGRRSLF